MKSSRFALLACALVLGMSGKVAQATMYRCETAGAITYSDRPCPDGQKRGAGALSAETESPETVARRQRAAAQLREDTLRVDQQLKIRADRDAQERLIVSKNTQPVRAANSKPVKVARKADRKSAKTRNGTGDYSDTESHRNAPSAFIKSRKLTAAKMGQSKNDQRLQQSP